MNTSPSSIENLRLSMLDLHKTLMDAQRVRYERDHGRIQTSGELLGLVLEHPSFAWLRTLSALIARLDEWIEEKEKAGQDELPALIDALKSLIETEGKDAAFNKPYWELANAVPEVLVAHVKLWRLIQPPGANGSSTRTADQPRG
jgi:hypothetical protein